MMGAWLQRMWTDEVAFKTAVATLGRTGIALAGALVTTGAFASLSPKVGPFVSALALLWPAGQKNPTAPPP